MKVCVLVRVGHFALIWPMKDIGPQESKIVPNLFSVQNPAGGAYSSLSGPRPKFLPSAPPPPPLPPWQITGHACDWCGIVVCFGAHQCSCCMSSLLTTQIGDHLQIYHYCHNSGWPSLHRRCNKHERLPYKPQSKLSIIRMEGRFFSCSCGVGINPLNFCSHFYLLGPFINITMTIIKPDIHSKRVKAFMFASTCFQMCFYVQNVKKSTAVGALLDSAREFTILPHLWMD